MSVTHISPYRLIWFIWSVSIYAISDRGDVKTLYNNGHWSDDELLNEDGVVFISEPNDPETFIPIPRDDLDELHKIQMKGFDEAQKAKDYEGEYEYVNII